MDASALVAQLRRSAAGEVRDDPASRELYACDASIYRRLPLAALRARDADDLDAAVAACRAHGVPLTMRGAGTSLAGQAVGRGLVVDCSALGGVEIDPDARDRPRGPGRGARRPERRGRGARPGLRRPTSPRPAGRPSAA